MGFLRRNQGRSDQRLFAGTPQELEAIGYASFGGDSPYPPGPNLSSLDHFVVAALESVDYPSPGSREHESLTSRFLTDLAAAGGQSAPWGIVGAFCIAMNFVTSEQHRHEAFLELVDGATAFLRDDGIAHTALPHFALQRWEELHGTEGLRPARWPSVLDPVAVPLVGEEPPVVDITEGESRRLSTDGPGANDRSTFAERTADGDISAIVDGVDVSDGVRKRWELGVRATSYPVFLRELGDRLGTPPWWVHEDLAPYIPCRQKGHAMRSEARRIAP